MTAQPPPPPPVSEQEMVEAIETARYVQSNPVWAESIGDRYVERLARALLDCVRERDEARQQRDGFNRERDQVMSDRISASGKIAHLRSEVSRLEGEVAESRADYEAAYAGLAKNAADRDSLAARLGPLIAASLVVLSRVGLYSCRFCGCDVTAPEPEKQPHDQNCPATILRSALAPKEDK